LGWTAKFISYDRFDWETIGTWDMLTLLDPLDVLDRPYQVVGECHPWVPLTSDLIGFRIWDLGFGILMRRAQSFRILNLGHWDLFEICFLVLGIFSALTRTPQLVSRTPQLVTRTP
jgi:hypothetical protein